MRCEFRPLTWADKETANRRAAHLLHARARVNHPGAAVSFASRYGPLRYATDAYEDSWYSSKALTGWQANVRAIALSLESLRAVDRYGVTRRGEQYTGWRAIEAPRGEFGSADEAERWMRGYARELGIVGPGDASALRVLYRLMAAQMHPDKGAPRAEWDRLDAARRLLDVR